MSEGSSIGGIAADSTNQGEEIFLKDYLPSEFLIESTELVFELLSDKTRVTSCLAVIRNQQSCENTGALRLQGQDLKLKSVRIDGNLLDNNQYAVSDSILVLSNVPDRFSLEIITEVNPANNLALEGLYLSDGVYCTQCEAKGFRRITYYLDRPDVMSVFTTRIIADKKQFPVLLSNGNLIDSDELDDGRHWATWHDPFKKPCYLFALVAGDLNCRQDDFVTQSGKTVTLQIYAEEKDLDKCDHAIQSLQQAMRWDEETYGREYDLDLYMIVAVDFFNMGAMENKGLNIFNTSCVLAHPLTQTDAAFQRVEAVVAHEYFHNWSGNRVTCRDWFQLSLKEGFTVFRDACFSADMNSETVKRIEDVNLLRSAQFTEDAGPMAHAVRPESFIEISNFYTLTIYEKGAEVIRMMHQLLGAEKFRCGSDLYFQRHDGQAVTCDDFVKAMEDASGVNLQQFKRWYSQSGTPVLDVTDDWDQEKQHYSLTIKQYCPATPGQQEKEPFYLPLNIALFNQRGLIDESIQVLTLSESEETFHFSDLTEKPLPSLLRGFSAPVILNYDYQLDDLLHLMTHEQDGFVRWDASRRYIMQLLKEHVSNQCQLDSEAGCQRVEKLATVVAGFINEGVGSQSCVVDRKDVCWDEHHDAALIAEILDLPSYQYLMEQFAVIDIAAIQQAVEQLSFQYSRALQEELSRCYQILQAQLLRIGDYRPIASDMALRSLKNTCLKMLLYKPLSSNDSVQLAIQQYKMAGNMTDQSAALIAMIGSADDAVIEASEGVLEQFYQQWQQEALVVNQWLGMQVSVESSVAFERLDKLLQHPAYDNTNPNKVRALIGSFCARNPTQFHSKEGDGYRLLTDEVIRLDPLNPQLAARMLAPLTSWRRFVEPNQSAMRGALQIILEAENLSPDVFEVVSKSLAS